PFNNFMPTKGTFSKLTAPEVSWLREDGAYQAGDSVNLFYDAMLSKLIVHGKDRDHAIALSRQLFAEYCIEGVQTTVPFHRWLLQQIPFCLELPTTSLIETYFTKESLEASTALFERDPTHRGLNYVEQFYVYPKEESTEVLVEVVHRSDGLYLARPRMNSQGFMPKEYWRLSPRKDWALTAVQTALES
ncbi:MAG: hypothetical protein KDD62_11085, partial [Bdellovibrionales bacterium]|nr:hypothetical protein [Bdellovibrionales bacterium]